MTQHWGKDGLVSWSAGQFKIRTYLVGYYGKKLKAFFISDLKEINMMICYNFILKHLHIRNMFCIFAMSSGRHTLHAASLQNTIINQSLLTFKTQCKTMARSVTYSVVPRRNPSEKGTPPMFYAQAQARGSVNLREMSERIQATCTVH